MDDDPDVLQWADDMRSKLGVQHPSYLSGEITPRHQANALSHLDRAGVSQADIRQLASDTYLPLNANGNGNLSDDQIEELKRKYIGRLGNERVDLLRKRWVTEVRRR